MISFSEDNFVSSLFENEIVGSTELDQPVNLPTLQHQHLNSESIKNQKSVKMC
jgi:hypothetical protein